MPFVLIHLTVKEPICGPRAMGEKGREVKKTGVYGGGIRRERKVLKKIRASDKGTERAHAGGRKGQGNVGQCVSRISGE